MIIVGFTHKTSKITPRILCRRFRHCAVIVPASRGADKPFVLHQFVRRGVVAQIPINVRDMNLLRAYGWVFVHIDRGVATGGGVTCVQYAKRVCGVRRLWIQRPDALWRMLQWRA